jgi:hypothetical protein
MGGLFGGGGNHVVQSSSPLSNLRLQTSSRGRAIPLAYGKTRVPGNLIDYRDFVATAHESTQSAGGKGGGGGDITTIDYTYAVGLIMAICAGPINSIPRIWRQKETYSGAYIAGTVLDAGESIYALPGLSVALANSATYVSFGAAYYDGIVDQEYPGLRRMLVEGLEYFVDGAGIITFAPSISPSNVTVTYKFRTPGYTVDACAQLGFTLSTGTRTQVAPGWMSTMHGADALGYRGVAMVDSASYALGAQADLLNHSFEVDTPFGYSAGIRDANIRDVILDLLTNPFYGSGFDVARIGDMTVFSNFCVASNIFVSPSYEEPTPVKDILERLMKIGNSAIVYSEGKCKVLPYGDIAISGNGVSYVPDVTPLYDLTTDDFQPDDDEDPVLVTRVPNIDAFNRVVVKFSNRDINYNEDVVDAKDQASIELYGLRQMETVELKEICNPATARVVAQLILQRCQAIRNQYEFKVGWRYDLLEPMDIVTLTDDDGLTGKPVRITLIEDEDSSGKRHVTAEDFPRNTHTAPRYATQASTGYATNFNVAAGSVNEPVIFEPPDQLAGGLQVWLGASGPSHYGGCHVWVSYDGETYRRIGTLAGKSRQGVLTDTLAAGAAIDATHTLSVDLGMCDGELISGTQDDARGLRTLCFADGELFAYADATLTGENAYDLAYLVRGAYGTTAGSHAAGSKFLRVDSTVFKFPFAQVDIGRAIQIKLQAFNEFGAGQQSLFDIEPYTYRLTGAALNSPLPNVQNLTSNFIDGISQLYWDTVTDFRTPLDYEVRLGATWATGTVVARTPNATIPAVGDGTYWVAAHFGSPLGVDAYSAAPTSLVIAGGVLTRNVLQTYDEAAAGWPGTVSGGAIVLGANVQLEGAGDFLSLADVLSNLDVLWDEGVAPSGGYRIPASHRVNVGRVAPCNIIMSIAGYAQSIYDNVLTMTDFLAAQDLLSAALGPQIRLQPQIATAGADGVYGAWQNYVPGTYNAQYFDAQVLLTSSDAQVFAVLSGFVFTVDVPDRIEKVTGLAVSAGGTAVAFSAPFNAVPNVQVTILNAQQGDTLQFTVTPTADGFTVRVINGGVGVARSVNWVAQGY